MTENEADWAEVLILTASPMIIPQPTTPPPLVHAQTQTWFMKAFRSTLRFDFLAVALLHETDTYGGWREEGVSQQLVWLFICLSRASRPGVIILLRACMKGGWWSWATMMWTWERSEDGWRKSPQGLRRRAPGSPLSFSARCRWHHRVRWQHFYLPRLHYTERNHGVLYLFRNTPSFHKPHLTAEHNLTNKAAPGQCGGDVAFIDKRVLERCGLRPRRDTIIMRLRVLSSFAAQPLIKATCLTVLPLLCLKLLLFVLFCCLFF